MCIRDSTRTKPLYSWLFGEDQGRYILATEKPQEVLCAAKEAIVPAYEIGYTHGHSLNLAGYNLELEHLRENHEQWLPNFMAGL